MRGASSSSWLIREARRWSGAAGGASDWVIASSLRHGAAGTCSVAPDHQRVEGFDRIGGCSEGVDLQGGEIGAEPHGEIADGLDHAHEGGDVDRLAAADAVEEREGP